MPNIFDSSGMTNPCEIWIDFKAGTDQGYFMGHDKAREEGDRKVNLGETLNLVPLFVHYGVTGFNKAQGEGFYSNEIRNANEVLTVKLGNELFAKGTWAEIKDKVTAKNGKWANIVYFCFFQRDSDNNIVPRIGAMKASGMAGSAFIASKLDRQLGLLRLITFSKGELIEEIVTQKGKKMKLDSPYWEMSIEKHKKFDDLSKQAVELAIDLKAFFDAYFSADNQQIPIEQETAEATPLISHSADIDSEFAEASQDDPLLLNNAPDVIDDLPF